ncbi:MAG TPA: diguanylate cyclase [Gammaproteobacteria bacterium]|nr:diguanylate cyclase [Gammaproteobacteria bacterium]
MTDFIDFETVCSEIPVGVLILDTEFRIRYWNGWLAEKTEVPADSAVGQRLEGLFPDGTNDRFFWAVEQALEYRIPQILSQALNHYLIPIAIPRSGRHGVPRMQQQVKVMPLAGRDGRPYALVIVQDVTENVIRSSALTEMVQKFRDVSLRDPLTNLFNRRFMWEWLLHHIKEAERYQSHVACLMLDIDGFKDLNDRLGHQRGDEILKGFARVVGEELRESDILVRYGGEEFAAFLPKCDLAHAVTSASRILERVRRSTIAGLPGGTVTCSIGVAVYQPDRPTTSEELLREADRRLYEAKRGGKDRVMPPEAIPDLFSDEHPSARPRRTGEEKAKGH